MFLNHLTDVCASWVSQAASPLKKAEQPMAAELSTAMDRCPSPASIVAMQGPLSNLKQENDHGPVLCDGTAGIWEGTRVCNSSAMTKRDGPANLDALVEVSIETKESVASIMAGDDDNGDLFGPACIVGQSVDWCLADMCPCDLDETIFEFSSLQTPSDLVRISAF